MTAAPLVIIGTGLAGYMLAKEWRKIQPDRQLILLTADDGAFYSKPLLSTALTQQKAPDQLVIMSAANMASSLSADIRTGWVAESIDIDRQIIKGQQHGKSVNCHYAQLVLACGSHCITLPMLEREALKPLESVFHVNNLTDYRGFRAWLANKKRIAVIGAGLVGCEFTNDLLNTERELQVVAFDAAPLAKFIPAQLGEQFRLVFEAQGVRWHLGKQVKALFRQDKQWMLELSDQQLLEVDGVFSAVGIAPNCQLAAKAGLQVNRGIVVDGKLRVYRVRLTQDNAPINEVCPNVFALGDCAEVLGHVYQYVAPLLQCARALAKILENEQAPPVTYPAMPIVVKTPLCPVVTCLPSSDIVGEWTIQSDSANEQWRGLFYDQTNQLRGFVLMGKAVREKSVLVKSLPSTF